MYCDITHLTQYMKTLLLFMIYTLANKLLIIILFQSLEKFNFFTVGILSIEFLYQVGFFVSVRCSPYSMLVLLVQVLAGLS